MSIYKSKHSGPQIDKAVDDIIRINDTIVTNMDGTKYLSDDGTYKEIKVPQIEVDTELSLESTKPVQNKVITEALDKKLEESDLIDYVKNTDYATSSVAGIVKVATTGAIRLNDNNILTISGASESEITRRTSGRPILPASLDYAIKSGMTTNTLTWTEEEKLAARTLIGVPQIIDNLTTDDATKVLSAKQGKILKDKVDGKSASYVCDNYEQAIAWLNNDTYPFKTGDNLFIVQLDVPDLWISGMAGGDEATYTYTTDEQFIADIRAATSQYGNYSGEPGLVVGKYRVCQLETQKVDLSNVVTKTEYEADMGDIDAALTAILEIQNSLISGEQTYDNIIDNVGAALDNIIAKQEELIGGGS